MGVGAPHHSVLLGTVACCLLFMLTAALLMTSSRSEGHRYFTCAENHGVLVALKKISFITKIPKKVRRVKKPPQIPQGVDHRGGGGGMGLFAAGMGGGGGGGGGKKMPKKSSGSSLPRRSSATMDSIMPLRQAPIYETFPEIVRWSRLVNQLLRIVHDSHPLPAAVIASPPRLVREGEGGGWLHLTARQSQASRHLSRC